MALFREPQAQAHLIIPVHERGLFRSILLYLQFCSMMAAVFCSAFASNEYNGYYAGMIAFAIVHTVLQTVSVFLCY